MESHFINGIISRIVVLNGLLTADVENFHHLIGTSASNTSSIWMELDGTDSFIMVMEGANVRLRGHVPKLAGSIFGSRGDQTRVWREHSCVDPVGMSADCEHESSVLQLEDLEVFVIGSG